MDQTIREIVQLDAKVEERLTAAQAQYEQQISEARARCAAITEASERQIRDTVVEYEEQAREACEAKLAELRADFDRKGDAMTKQFETQRAELLEVLFRDTLADAEA